MAVYLECERCRGSSYGERYCDECEAVFAADPTQRPDQEPAEHPKTARQKLAIVEDKVTSAVGAVLAVAVVIALVVGVVAAAVFAVRWVANFEFDEPSDGKIDCSEQLEMEIIEDRGLWEAIKWSADHCK